MFKLIRDDLEWAYSIVLSRSFSASMRTEQKIEFPDFLAEDYSMNAFLCPFIGSRLNKCMFETEIYKNFIYFSRVATC